MARRRLIFKTILIVLGLALLFVGYRLLSYHLMRSKVTTFNIQTSDQAMFTGLVDDRVYRVENGKFEAFNKDGKIFELPGEDLNFVDYGKELTLVENSGNIQKVNRKTGQVERGIVYESPIFEALKTGDDLAIFTEDSAVILDDKLNQKRAFTGLTDPVVLDTKDDRTGIVGLSMVDGTVISNFYLYEGDEKTFELSTNRETFFSVKMVGTKTILFSNAYIYVIENGGIVDKIMVHKLEALDQKDDQLVIVDRGQLIIFDSTMREIARKDLGQAAKEISIRKESIVILGDKDLMVYDNANIVTSPAAEALDLIENDKAAYVVFTDRIEKVNAH